MKNQIKPMREVPFTPGQDPKWCGSTLKKVTTKECESAKKHFEETGECDHTIIYDIDGWPYWVRYCYVCEKCLGVI